MPRKPRVAGSFQARGTNRWYKQGPFGICSCCEERTFIRTGSIFGEISHPDDVLRDELIERILHDILHWCWRCVVCKKEQTRELFWIELNPDVVRGPLCAAHFEDEVAHELGGDQPLQEDAFVYRVRNSKTTEEALDFFEAVEDEEDSGLVDDPSLAPEILF